MNKIPLPDNGDVTGRGILFCDKKFMVKHDRNYDTIILLLYKDII